MPTQFEHDVDELFRLPLAEFTTARNTLAAQLKKSGRRNEADFVKGLGKPSISAWAVNQLYWNHREAFDQLIASGERFRQAQTSRLTRKVTDMREALDARRDALSNLSDLAAALLRDAGHNPTQDTIRRITTTLEGMSAYASLPDGPSAGRLTHDVDPPGFESLSSFTPATSSPRKVEPAADVVQLKETRQASIAAAKALLQEAKRSLTDARARAPSLEATQKKASAEAKEAEKHRREAEQRFERAKAASEDATRRVRSVAVEVEEATKVVKDAERRVERASKELEELFSDS